MNSPSKVVYTFNQINLRLSALHASSLRIGGTEGKNAYDVFMSTLTRQREKKLFLFKKEK